MFNKFAKTVLGHYMHAFRYNIQYTTFRYNVVVLLFFLQTDKPNHDFDSNINPTTQRIKR